jgi:Na+/H+ antiporter NhaD/arsenite permease-like protein
MSLPLLSLCALLGAVLLSCVSKVNVGLLSLLLAWGVAAAGGLGLKDVVAAFPAALFLTLLGVSFLFAAAEGNGTLQVLANALLRLARGNAGWVTLSFFLLGAVLSGVGAGAIAATALVAPLAMRAAGRLQVSPFLMTVIVGNGANAGNLSLFTPVGVVAGKIYEQMGIAGQAWALCGNHLLAHVVLTGAVFLGFGGWALLGRPAGAQEVELQVNRAQWGTLALIGLLLAGVAGFGLPIGFGALLAGMILTLTGAAREDKALAAVPWPVILLVCGVTTLVGMMEKLGGLDLFSSWIAQVATPGNSTAVMGFVSGIVSAYSSTSGVVLPAFLPMAQKLVQQMGGGEVGAIVASINLGSHLVDVSPLSTIGAMCIAAAPEGVDRERLFRQLFAWGLAMSVVGAGVSWLLFGVLHL